MMHAFMDIVIWYSFEDYSVMVFHQAYKEILVDHIARFAAISCFLLLISKHTFNFWFEVFSFLSLLLATLCLNNF